MVRGDIVRSAAVAACAVAAGQASAQFQANFESLTQGSLVGQDGWTQPVAGSNDWRVVSYGDAAAFNVAPHPTGGGTHVAAATGFGSTAGFARTEHNVNWSSSAVWTICMDFWADYQGDPVTHASNVGSLSNQPFGATPYTNQGINMLWYYNQPGNVASQYSIAWNIHNPDGTDVGVFYNPDDATSNWPNGMWSTLELRKWYRASFVMDFASGQLVKMGVSDLQTGEGRVFETAGLIPSTADGNWYMAGGAANVRGLPMPERLRMFVGGQGNGNVMAFDNLSYTHGDNLCVTDTTPSGCAADFNGDQFLDFFDYSDYVQCFETGACPAGRDADFNEDDFVDFFDYSDYVTAFEAGC